MRSGTVIGSLGFLAALALARNAVGGSTAGITIVSLLPVFQTALYVRDRRALWIVLAGVLGFYLAPLVIVGPPEYPNSGYRSALLAVAVSSIVGLVTHGLVADIRRRAREARRRERMLVRINETVQGLSDSPNPRRDACDAVKEISEAIVAGLYEPESGSQTLRLSATDSGDASGQNARSPSKRGPRGVPLSPADPDHRGHRAPCRRYRAVARDRRARIWPLPAAAEGRRGGRGFVRRLERPRAAGRAARRRRLTVGARDRERDRSRRHDRSADG